MAVSAWAVTFSTLGYLFGNAMELLLGRIKRYEITVAASIALLALVIWLVRHLLQWRRDRTQRGGGKEG